MTRCHKPIVAKVSRRRGWCTRPRNHAGPHHNEKCSHCGLNPRNENHPYLCSSCQKEKSANRRRLQGKPLARRKNFGQIYVFPCGCSGTLPNRGESTQFVTWNRFTGFACRARVIIQSSKGSAKQYGYKHIDASHSVIRSLMVNSDCIQCGQPLSWSFQMGKTPHLHHNHETGQPIGFAHLRCNVYEMQQEIHRLLEENRQLKSSLAGRR